MRHARLPGLMSFALVLGMTQGGVVATASDTASDSGRNNLASRLSNRGLSASEILRILRGSISPRSPSTCTTRIWFS